MAPPGLFNALDPTLHFLLGSYVSVVFVDADPSTKTLSVKVPSREDLIAHFIDPGVFIGLAMFVIFMVATRNDKVPLSRSRSLAANWHLWNAIIIYTVSSCVLQGGAKRLACVP